MSNVVRLAAMDISLPLHKAALHKAAKILGGQAGIAKTLRYADRRNVSPWFTTDRLLPPEHCVAIEQATEREVMRWDLRPSDWWLIWPELIGADGAPVIPEPEARAA